MKLLCVIPSLKNTSPICWLVSLIEQLPQKNNITVYTLDDVCYAKELEAKLIGMGVNIVYGEGAGLIGLVRNILNLRKVTSSKEYSKILSMLLRPDIATSFCSGARCYSSIRNSVTEEYFEGRHWLLAKFVTWLHVLSLKVKHVCIVMSEGMDTKLSKAGIHNTTIIPNSLDTIKLENSRSEVQVYIKNKWSTVPKIIIVGSLIQRKKVIESVHLFHKLLRSGHEFFVEILGDGPLRNEIELILRSFAPEHAKFIALRGHIDNPIPAIESSDIFFMNSECEGVSRSLLEAAYLNKILFVRENDGVNDLINAGVQCYKFASQEGAKELLENYLRNASNFEKSKLPEKYNLKNGALHYMKLLDL